MAAEHRHQIHTMTLCQGEAEEPSASELPALPGTQQGQMGSQQPAEPGTQSHSWGQILAEPECT